MTRKSDAFAELPGIGGERGVALLITIMATLLLSALGAALLLTTSAETRIAANFRSSTENLYAADAALERVLADLTLLPDWSLAAEGLARSAFADGSPSGPRTLGDSSTIDLGQIANMANCEKTTPCSDPEMDAVTADRPWGARNPRWSLFAYGPLASLLPSGGASSTVYLVVLAAGSLGQGSPAPDALALRAEAFGSRGGFKAVEATVARTDTGVRLLSWRVVR